MTVLVVAGAGAVEAETWYLRLEGILYIWVRANDSMPEMMRSGRNDLQLLVNESRWLV